MNMAQMRYVFLFHLALLGACSNGQQTNEKTQLLVSIIPPVTTLSDASGAIEAFSGRSATGLVQEGFCYAIHITGEGLNDTDLESENSCEHGPQGFGKVFGPYAYGKDAEVSVDAGSNRRIDLIGFLNPYDDDPDCSKSLTFEKTSETDSSGKSRKGIKVLYGERELDPKDDGANFYDDMFLFAKSENLTLSPGVQEVDLLAGGWVERVNSTGLFSVPQSYTCEDSELPKPTITSPFESDFINQRQFEVSGEGLYPGGQVVVNVSGIAGNSTCTATDVAGDGTWACTLESQLGTPSVTVGAVIEARHETAGGESSEVAVVTISYDVAVPSVPTVALDDSHAGYLTFVGTAEEFAVIDVSEGVVGGTCNTSADNLGNWKCTLDQPVSTTYSVDVKQTDRAGNQSAGASLGGSAPKWQQQAYLKAPNVEGGDLFGNAVSLDEDSIVVGAYRESSSYTQIYHNGDDFTSIPNDEGFAGAAYVFKRSGTIWALESMLKAPNAGTGHSFGGSLSIDGNFAVVGAYGEKALYSSVINGSDLSLASGASTGTNVGAAYVYERSGSNWSHQAYLKAPNAHALAQFGYDVSISGDTVAVGASRENSDATEIVQGSDLSSLSNFSGDQNGAVYIYKKDGSNWSTEAYLKAPNGSEKDRFGFSVVIEDDVAVVGAVHEDSSTTTIMGSEFGTPSSGSNSTTGKGAVYVFRRSADSTWQYESYLVASNAEGSDYFGTSVGLSGETVVVGAEGEDSNTTNIVMQGDWPGSVNNDGGSNGAVYVFARNTSGQWEQEAYLKAPNNSGGDEFGSNLDVDGDRIAVGVLNEDSGTTSVIMGSDLSSTDDASIGRGAVYLFSRVHGAWHHEAYLKPPVGSGYYFFGWSVSLEGNTLVVGAPKDDSNQDSVSVGASSDISQPDSGAAYVFVLE